MKKHLQTFVLIAALVGLAGMSACSSATPTPAPTQDLNPLRTEVAATVLAQVTQTLAAAPTATPQPSPTPSPTLTPTPTLLGAPLTVTLAAPGAGTPLASTPLALTPQATTVNRAQWVSQSIADDTVMAPGQVFTITWQLKNVGATAWTPNFLLRFYSGNNFGYASTEVPIGQEVPPGGLLSISLKMTAPVTPGNYRTDWVLSDAARSNFKDPVFLKIIVAPPPSPTPAPTATPGVTATP